MSMFLEKLQWKDGKKQGTSQIIDLFPPFISVRISVRVEINKIQKFFKVTFIILFLRQKGKRMKDIFEKMREKLGKRKEKY